MPHCDNCGAFVSVAYYRVFAVGVGRGRRELRSCQHCGPIHGGGVPE